MRFELEVNALPVVAEYRDEDVDRLLFPLVEHWAGEQAELGRRMIVLLGAAPGTGKTALALTLAKIAAERRIALQALGLDGFHYPNAYLDTHTHMEDGHEVTLRSRKGADFTFDAVSLAEHLMDARDNAEPKAWPEYSRKLHDPVPEALPITGDILLVEGNYLLLPEEPWTEIASLADETVFLDAPEELLRGRLVTRKIAGGSSEEEAAAWYEASDGRNVRKVLAAHLPATHELRLGMDGSITRANRTRGSAS